MTAPVLMVTAVNTDGLETEPFIFEGAGTNGSNTIGYNIRPSVFYKDGKGELIVRLNFMAAATKTAFRSGMYGRFTGGRARFVSAGISFALNRVCRFTRSHIPGYAAPGTTEADYRVEGNFSVDGDVGTNTTVSGMGVYLSSPLFATDVVLRDDRSTTDVETPTTFSWQLPELTGIDHYVIYALDHSGQFREIDITTDASYAIGPDEPFEDLGSIPLNSGRKYHIGQFPFRSENNYPGAVSFYKQRKIFGGTNNQPDTLWFSAIGDYGNFVVDTEDNAAIEVTLASNTIDRITHCVPLRDMFILTEGSTWVLRNQGALTPANISFEKAGDVGSPRTLDPFIVDGLLLLVPPTRNDVAQLVFDYNTESYSLKSLTTLARHLFTSPIRDVAYVGNQHPILALSLEDGTGLVAAINRTDDIIAWSQWSTLSGRFNRFLPDPKGNGLYLLIRRDIDDNDPPNTQLYLERFQLETTSYVDHNGPVDDNNDVMPYTFTLDTLPLEGENGIGIADTYSISDIFVKVANTTTFNIGVDRVSTSVSMTAPTSSTIRARVGDSWNIDSRVVISDTTGNAFELLALAVEGRVSMNKATGDMVNVPQQDN